jgi:phosphate transport system substrate-binding protein
MSRFLVPATAGALALVALAPAATAQAPQAHAAKTTITMSGSTSIAPLASKLAKAYLNKPGIRSKVGFRLSQGGSDIGIADVSRARVTIGNSSRDPQPTDPGGLVFNKVARDAICVITNKQNPIPNISQETVQAIFSGQVRSWSQVPGAKVSGPIDLVVRTAASGTQDAFQNIFMGLDKRVSPSATVKSSNGLQAQAVKSNPNAIGYASFNFTKGLWDTPYKGVGCTLRNAKSGQYLGTRNFWMVTRGRPKGAAKAWIRWIRSSSAARSIVASDWVPLR